MAKALLTQKEMKERLINTLQAKYYVSDPNNASNEQLYNSMASIMVPIMMEKRRVFTNKVHSEGRKQVYYISMEFLLGRSLKTTLFNFGLTDTAEKVLSEYGVKLSDLYECEPDAGLGNGGLGRLAACYLDGLASDGYSATGYSLLYEYGMFRQKLEAGWQTELPDQWLPGGSVWLVPRPEQQVQVNIGGSLREYWDSQYHHVTLDNPEVINAIPYDLFVSGYDSEEVSKLRLWKAVSAHADISWFTSGDESGNIQKQFELQNRANSINQVLYPNDNNRLGQELRLKQQYFMCAASVGDIVNHHMATYGTLDNLADKVAVQINDTHPTLAIPELMRILLDDCGYSWDKSWNIVTHTFCYTNHTVMAEALEKWDDGLLKSVAPRVHSIIVEINNRYCGELWEATHDPNRVNRMSIIRDGKVHMAKLCACACSKINGVSVIHSDIIKNSVFKDEYEYSPSKFTNVTNGIAYRRWLCQSNKPLCELLDETINSGYKKDASKLKKLEAFKDDEEVLRKLAAVKHKNKESFAKYIRSSTGITVNPDSIFDVQVKRLHEYKRQQLNVLNIIRQYLHILNNPNEEFTPKTYIFAAKAASGYYIAKQIIKLIWCLSSEIDKNPLLKDKLSVVFLENYNVTMSESLMPAAEISEQISLAGTEASGTGNMKLMLNGAVTLGTRDGANIEIGNAAGEENIIFFGMNAEEVETRKNGYGACGERIISSDPELTAIIDYIEKGVNGQHFDDIINMYKYSDGYMALPDYKAYCAAQDLSSEIYKDTLRWQKMSLMNIANAGVFSADRAVREYAHNIWHLPDPPKNSSSKK